MKYSFASYLNFARSLPGASDCTDSYIAPGPVIGPVTVGSATAVGVAGRTAAGPPRPPPPPPCPPGPWAPPCPSIVMLTVTVKAISDIPTSKRFLGLILCSFRQIMAFAHAGSKCFPLSNVLYIGRPLIYYRGDPFQAEDSSSRRPQCALRVERAR